MRVILGMSLAALLFLPAHANAQRRGYNPFSFDPYIGAFWDAYDLEADDSNLGFLIGFKAGYQPGYRWNVNLNLGYAHADDVATPLITPAVYDNQWVLATAGGDFALVPGNTSVAIGGAIGVGWRRIRLDEPEIDVGVNDRWNTYEVLTPSLIFRHRFTPSAAFWASIQDHIFDVFDSDAEHSFALIVGLSFR